MPRGDRTGPMGMGPRTGWGTGYCSGAPGPGLAGTGFGRGAGYGRGFGGGCGFGGGRRGGWNMNVAPGLSGGRRFGWGAMAPPMGLTGEREKQLLQDQAESLQAELGEIKRRLDALSSEEAK